MAEKYDWLEKKTPRSIEQLRLWNENPRLNPEEKHITLADFTEDFISDENEKKHFFDLLKSIAEEYVPADPIIVWRDPESQKFYVAEGNRRVLALKLLNDPNKAPKSIRAHVRNLAKGRTPVDKIKVNVAPSLEDAEWYINQRNSVSTLQRPWSRIQQQRWIESLYKKYGNNIELLIAKSAMTQGELENAIRNLRFVDLIKSPEIKGLLNDKQYKEATSYKFPVTIIERFFINKQVREQWGVEFDGLEVKLRNRSGFLKAYAELIKNIVDENPAIQIDTRTITTKIDEILKGLPTVDLSVDEPYATGKDQEPATSEKQEEAPNNEKTNKDKPILKGDPNRNRLILSCYSLDTSNYRLEGIFNELKKLSVNTYSNAIAASIRIFLDLSVLNWLQVEDKVSEIQKKYSCSLRDITLKNRLTFVGENISAKEKKASSIITQLLNPSHGYSLDILNGYQHSNDSCYLNKPFINGFWDFLFPLFEVLLDIKENNSQDV